MPQVISPRHICFWVAKVYQTLQWKLNVRTSSSCWHFLDDMLLRHGTFPRPRGKFNHDLGKFAELIASIQYLPVRHILIAKLYVECIKTASKNQYNIADISVHLGKTSPDPQIWYNVLHVLLTKHPVPFFSKVCR